MEIAEREAMARTIVHGNCYTTLGTADADRLPWASPIWYGARFVPRVLLGLEA